MAESVKPLGDDSHQCGLPCSFRGSWCVGNCHICVRDGTWDVGCVVDLDAQGAATRSRASSLPGGNLGAWRLEG